MLIRAVFKSKSNKLFIIATLIIFSNFLNCEVKPDQPEQKLLFDLNWKFSRGNSASAFKVDFDDQNWLSLDLPHNWNVDEIRLHPDSKGMKDSLNTTPGWYRKHFEVPLDWSGKRIFIHFEEISTDSEVFINGTQIDGLYNKDHSFDSSLNSYLNFQGKNVIAVRVAGQTQDLKSQNNQLGIFKHVWLVIKESSELEK